MKVRRISIQHTDPDGWLCPGGYEININDHTLSYNQKWLVVALLESVWHFWRWRLWRRDK